MAPDVPHTLIPLADLKCDDRSFIDEVMVFIIGVASILTLCRALFGPDCFSFMSKKNGDFLTSPRYAIETEKEDEISRSVDRLGGENMEGFLWKKGHRIKSWRRRYFVLNIEGKLKYYSNPEEFRRGEAPKGSFSVYTASAWEGRPFGIQISSTLGCLYYLYAEKKNLQKKWILCLSRRAPKVSIRGRFLSALSDLPVLHKLEICINSSSGLEKDRQYYAVVKFKSELHDFSQTSVGQTSVQRTSGQVFLLSSNKIGDSKTYSSSINNSNYSVTWDEKFSWNFLDHECETCSTCLSAGITLGIFRGFPYTLVCQIWEATMFKDKKIASSTVGLIDIFGYAGMESSHLVSSWPAVHNDEIIGHTKLTLSYKAERATGKQPFLNSCSAQRYQIGPATRTIVKIQTAEEFFDYFYSDDCATLVWDMYYKKRGDTQVVVGRWQKSALYGGKVREITCRSLTNSPIGPSTTRATITEHALFSDDRSIFIHSRRVVLNDIPYGDCFTVETEQVVTTNSSKTGIDVVINLAVPFTKGCMWKSKIQSSTQVSVTEAFDFLYQIFNEKMESEELDCPNVSPMLRLEAMHSNFSSALEFDSCDEERTRLHRTQSTADGTLAVEEIFENQRVSLFGRWGPGHLLPTDRPRFSNRLGDKAMDFTQVVCPSGWVWDSSWKIDYNYTKCDEEGWSYATDFPRFNIHLQRERSSTKRLGASVRRRRWIGILTKLP